MIKTAIHKAINNQDLSYDVALSVMDMIMSGNVSDIQMASYLTAMALKGETIDEITGSAKAMRNHCVRILNDVEVLEIVGTGGDRLNTFNISTTSSFVVSAAGIPVAKHGNRAASSRSGSADLIEALGCNLNISPERSKEILEEIGLCFLFAQNYHIAMKYVAPVRKELGFRTIFNILGPLSNPAGATMQLLGVYDEDLVEPMANVLSNLGVKNALVVHGKDGLDEISMCAPTVVCEVRGNNFRKYEISPENFGFKRCSIVDLVGGSPQENAEITRNILMGERGPKRDAVVLNSAGAIFVARPDITLEGAIAIAEEMIDSGKALRQMKNLVSLSKE